MIHKLHWFNDTSSPQRLVGPSGLNEPIGLVNPRSSMSVEVTLKDGQKPFIKMWDNGIVFISGIADTTIDADAEDETVSKLEDAQRVLSGIVAQLDGTPMRDTLALLVDEAKLIVMGAQ